MTTQAPTQELPGYYPEIEPNRSGMLAEDELHTIYWEQSGNPAGLPVVFIHGGPGAGSSADNRRFFDPKIYRIVIFDQRGCGRSTPLSELTNNTTWDLVADMEKIRAELAIDRWVVFGGSWGSTLGMAYAISHPANVLAMVLRGIFLCRPKEIHWFYQSGASKIFPDAYEKYVSVIPSSERGDLLMAFARRLFGDSADDRGDAADAWATWEMSLLSLIPDEPDDEQADEEYVKDHSFADAFARLECHYFTNNVFFDTDNWLIEHVDVIRHIPAVLVHGRYDLVCPVESAWELHNAWPEARLQIIADAGHSASEPGTRAALRHATDEFSSLASRHGSAE